MGKIKNLWIIRKIDSHPIGHLLLNDLAARGTASLYQGLIISLLYAGFKLITSFIYDSVWFGAVAIYYILLCIIRGELIHTVLSAKQYTDDNEKLLREYIGYRRCGYLMLLLNIGMLSMIIQMVWQNQGNEYSGLVIYMSAVYTFCILIIAIINVIRFKKVNRPALSASKVINLTAAFMSILVLQTSMISQFGGGAEFCRIMNAITGSAVCLLTLCMAVYMIINAKHQIKKQKGTS